MVQLAAVRAALVSVIQTAVGTVNVSPYYVQQVNPPQIVIDTSPLVEEFATFDGSVDLALRLVLLASLGEDSSGQALLDTWIANTGSGSIVAAINANPRLTVGGVPACDYCVITRVGTPGAAGSRSGYGVVDWGGIPYLGTNILLDVAASN